MPGQNGRTVLFVFALAASLPQPVMAQQALVLSGGGARGLAHIGVLQRLEELGYDPDLIIGNSMGAVVGALYAAGYDADEIVARTLAIRWSVMFDATPSLIGPARDARLPLLTFSLDVGRRRVARGLFGEWRINRALVHQLFEANTAARGDFDRLPRRYRAIAADLQTGDKVVLGSGDLARAARASMAFPGVFAPVSWRERWLVDGGIVDNLPTLEARRLGARNIIAVDVSRAPDTITSLAALPVVQRSLDLMQRHLHPDSLAPDVLIVPETGELLSLAFADDPRPIIELGRRAAQQTLLSPAVPRRAARARVAAPAAFGALRVQAPDTALARLTRAIFERVAPGPYDADAVLAAVDRLYSTGLVDGVWPSVSADEPAGSAPTLLVSVDAPARFALALGAGFDNDRGGRAWAALERSTILFGKPATLTAAASTDGVQRWAALSAKLHALFDPTITGSIGTHVQEHTVRTLARDTQSTTDVVRGGGWIGIELPRILRENVITLTARAEAIKTESTSAATSYGPLLRITSAPTDARVVGAPLLIEAETRWGAHKYRRANASISVSRRATSIQAAATADVRIVSSDAPLDVQPALGDDHALPGLQWGERRGPARAFAGIDIAHAAPVNGFVRVRLRAGTITDEPSQWQHARWLGGAQIGGIWRQPLGLLELGYGYATTGAGRFDVSVGRSF